MARVLSGQVVIGDLIGEEGVHNGTEGQPIRPARAEVFDLNILEGLQCVCVWGGGGGELVFGKKACSTLIVLKNVY